MHNGSIKKKHVNCRIDMTPPPPHPSPSPLFAYVHILMNLARPLSVNVIIECLRKNMFESFLI